MVDYAIKKELESDCYDKIFLYSDAAGGQNRNYTMLQYMSALSVELQLEIHHIFPVRGHSYCQCDRNFGLHRHKKMKRERIETETEYVDLIKHLRNPPFEMVDVSQFDMKDYEQLFAKDEDLQKNTIKIIKVVKIVCFPNGQVDLYYSYDGTPKTVKLIKSVEIDLSKGSSASAVGVTKEKRKDFEHLLQFCSPSGQDFGKNFLSTTSIKIYENIKKEKVELKNEKDDSKRKLKLEADTKKEKIELEKKNEKSKGKLNKKSKK